MTSPNARVPTFAVLSIVLSGCAFAHARYAEFTPSTSVPVRAGRPLEEVQVLFAPDAPGCKHRVVGLYRSGRKMTMTYNGMADPEVKPMREDAAVRGFDGVMDVDCSPETGNCTGRAFVCES